MSQMLLPKLSTMQFECKSILHKLEHPSLGRGLPSSHSSSLALTPSPQVEWQSSGVKAVVQEQEKPRSTVQFEQPSLEMVFWSSQSSKGKRIKPFPQKETQVEGIPEQLNPELIIPWLEQPSLSTKFPSSHCSSPMMNPSPCLGVQMSGVVSVPPKQTHLGSTS